MLYNKLGRTDINVSSICLGTMTWGVQNTENDAHEQMDYALDQGVNFFDTAELYAIPPSPETQGKTEEYIGSWFAKNGNRDKVILASKIVGTGISWIRGGDKIDRKNIHDAVEGSLKRLQTDYIDLYQLHWPNRGSYHFGQQWGYTPKFNKDAQENNFIEVLETLGELIKAGKIRHVGLSNETAWGMMTWLRLAEERGLPRMVSVQNEYSLLYRSFDQDLHEIAMAEDCGLLAYSPLAGGILSGKYIDGARPKGTRLTLSERFSHRDTPNANEAVKAYTQVAQKHGLDICQMALAFVNSRPHVTSNIIGATSMEQLKTNIGSANITLSSECLKDIAQIYKTYPMPF